MASSVVAGSAVAAKLSPAAALASSKNGVSGKALQTPAVRPVAVRQATPVCRAQQADDAVTRRATLAGLAAALTAAGASPALAAYGEAANIFAAPKQSTGFNPYSGAGFSLDVPSKWNPSKEIEYQGQVVRFEDNFDATNNLVVLALPASKSSIEGYGSPEQFLNEVSFLLGQQSYDGQTSSEGGFQKDKVSTAAILETYTPKVDGRTYYKLDVLTRTADGDEGGKHQLISATVADGKLYIFKGQAGDKRWFKGVKKFVVGAWDSFNVA